MTRSVDSPARRHQEHVSMTWERLTHTFALSLTLGFAVLVLYQSGVVFMVSVEKVPLFLQLTVSDTYTHDAASTSRQNALPDRRETSLSGLTRAYTSGYKQPSIQEVDTHTINVTTRHVGNTSLLNRTNVSGYERVQNRVGTQNAHTLEAPSFGNKDFTLKVFNKMVSDARLNMIQNFDEYRKRGLLFRSSSSDDAAAGDDDTLVLRETDGEKYTNRIDQISHIVSLNLKWSVKSKLSVSGGNSSRDVTTRDVYPLSETQHEWSVSEGLCEIFDGKRKRKCRIPQSNRTVIADETLTQAWPASFLHVIPNATVHTEGHVRTPHIHFIPLMCRCGTVQEIEVENGTKYFKEVFVIAQHYGAGFFHISIEEMPRLAPYLDFLKAHSHIKIHTFYQPRMTTRPALDRYFALLGLDPDRIINGSVQADIVYLPAGGRCGNLREPHGQILSSAMRSHIRAQFPQETAQPARTLVLIERTRTRALKQFGDIKIMLQSIAQTYSLELKIFSDAPIPSERDAWLMFYNAVMIVAPHGAGLSNMLLSRPGIYVVEIICALNPNFCFKTVSVGQGNYYRGILSTTGGTSSCKLGMTVDIEKVTEAVKAFLDFDSSRNRYIT